VPAYQIAALASFIDRTNCWPSRASSAQGFKAMKCGSVRPTRRPTSARVKAVRDALGPISIDADAIRVSTNRAIRLWPHVSIYSPKCFEDPLPAWDLEGLARLSAALDTPYRRCETEYPVRLPPLLGFALADLLMPDSAARRRSRFMRVGHMA